MAKGFKKNIIDERGVTMLLTLIILAVVLASAIAAAGVVVLQIRLAGNAADSVGAIYAADTGVEWQLYNIRHGTTTPPGVPPSTATGGTLINGATYNTFLTWGAQIRLESIGTYRSAKRKFQLTF